MQKGYLNTNLKKECYGCEACVQACPVKAITMKYDDEKFLYPVVNAQTCINCGKCNKVCPFENKPISYLKDKYVFGGHIDDEYLLSNSTSGGAFSAIVNGWCDKNYIIFGAKSDGLEVYHTYIEDKKDLILLMKSKYSQSRILNSYQETKQFLKQDKKVLFSGTPCQIAGLINYLGEMDKTNLLTVEVICEGVPTPLYIDRFNEYISVKYKSDIKKIDYRYKDMKTMKNPVKGKWDFEVMQLTLKDGRTIKKDRWFNPFWSIWLSHLMSRPSCYQCAFATQDRVADISLGDLWGVHLYCPDLYAKNAGASLVICNTLKGKEAFISAKPYMIGRELKFEEALRYQSPLRKHIDNNDDREQFMNDIKDMNYSSLCKKYARPPSVKLLWQKYVWGNRQKMWLWNLINKEKNNA